MTELNLNTIEARANAATPGPWERGERYHVQGASHCECLEHNGPLTWEGQADINGEMMHTHVHRSEEPWHKPGINAQHDEGSISVVIETEEYGLMTDEDAAFIAASRSDIPALVAEVRRLRAARDRVLKRHFPVEALMYTGKQQRLVKVCGECGTDDGNWKRHPCPTVTDLEGETP